MICTSCGRKSVVLDTRAAPFLVTMRRRQCSNCGTIFKTYEINENLFRKVGKAHATMTANAVRERIHLWNRSTSIAQLHATHTIGQIAARFHLGWDAARYTVKAGAARLAKIAKHRGKV